MTEDNSYPTKRFADALEQPEALWAEVKQELLTGKSLPKIGRERGYPVLRFCAWVVEDVGRAAEFNALLLMAAHVHVAEAVEIADSVQMGVKTKTKETVDGTFVETLEADMIEHRRLQIDTRLRVAEKIDPARWASKVRVAVPGEGQLDGALDGLAAALLDRMRVVSTQERHERVIQPVAVPDHGLI